MRVLLTSYAAKTHFQNLVPLGWALHNAGHEVRVASHPMLTRIVTSSGLTAAPVGADWELARFMTEYPDEQRFIHGIDFTTDGRERWDWAQLLGMETVLVPCFYSFVNNAAFIDGLVDFALDWRPDLVVWESLSFAGAVAARVSGAAHARLTYWYEDILAFARAEFVSAAADQPPTDREDPTAEWLGGALRRYGHDFDEEIVTGQWTIDTMPPSAHVPLGVQRVPMRYVPYNGPAEVPDWLHGPADRPRICLTLGVTGREGAGGRTAMVTSMVSLPDLLDAMADLDVEVVATLDESQRDGLPPLPDNVRLVDFVPLQALLPTCAAIVHHGGVGTWFTAATYGVPQIIVATSWDTPIRAQRTEERDAGLAVPAAELTPEVLRDKVIRVLEEPRFAAGAGRLRDELLATPTPADIVPELVRLTEQHQGGGRGA